MEEGKVVPEKLFQRYIINVPPGVPRHVVVLTSTEMNIAIRGLRRLGESTAQRLAHELQEGMRWPDMPKQEVDTREELKAMGFVMKPGYSYPEDSEVGKFTSLQKLMREWLKSMIQSGEVTLNAKDAFLAASKDVERNYDEWLDEYLDEATEEWLVG